MTTIADIYRASEHLINEILKKEIVAQGHHLTGALEDSLQADVSKKGSADLMEGFANYYAQFVNDGFPAASATFKQVPFLIEYFKQRGLGEKEATGAAFATVKKWMNEGMPTQASKRFSQTGSRTNMIESAFLGAEVRIDEVLTNGFDFVVEEKFQKEKSETI